MKTIVVVILMFMSLGSYAHNPDLSTTVLSKTKDGKYLIQISSSLTAFEGEIDFIYQKGAYNTPEEFKKLVIEHFKKNVSFTVNSNQTLIFSNPVVLLGHETKVVFEIVNVPTNISKIKYSNTMFKDMPHNQMSVIMMADGFPKKRVMLDNKNSQTMTLLLENDTWNEVSMASNFSAILSLKNLGYAALFLLIIAVPFFYFRRKNNLSK